MASPDPGVNAHDPIQDANPSTVVGPESPVQSGSAHIATALHTDGAGNGQRLAIDELQGFSPNEWEVVRRSDEAFNRLGQTWENWKQLSAGLVVLRERAMRETGSVNIRSKRYKDRFHQLLEDRPYCSAKMSASTRKALLKCAELSPELDEWYATLDEHRRDGLNHPGRVLDAFREAKGAKRASANGRARHETELETVRQEAAVAISSRDAQGPRGARSKRLRPDTALAAPMRAAFHLGAAIQTSSNLIGLEDELQDEFPKTCTAALSKKRRKSRFSR
jgi:hypothetical protein